MLEQVHQDVASWTIVVDSKEIVAAVVSRVEARIVDEDCVQKLPELNFDYEKQILSKEFVAGEMMSLQVDEQQMVEGKEHFQVEKVCLKVVTLNEVIGEVEYLEVVKKDEVVLCVVMADEEEYQQIGEEWELDQIVDDEAYFLEEVNLLYVVVEDVGVYLDEVGYLLMKEHPAVVVHQMDLKVVELDLQKLSEIEEVDVPSLGDHSLEVVGYFVPGDDLEVENVETSYEKKMEVMTFFVPQGQPVVVPFQLHLKMGAALVAAASSVVAVEAYFVMTQVSFAYLLEIAYVEKAEMAQNGQKFEWEEQIVVAYLYAYVDACDDEAENVLEGEVEENSVS